MVKCHNYEINLPPPPICEISKNKLKSLEVTKCLMKVEGGRSEKLFPLKFLKYL